MDDAQGPGQPPEAGGAGDQLAGRYAIGARLGHNGQGMQTFSATDRWLHRPVIMVFDAGSGGRALTKACQSMAGVFSPNLIDIYDRGGNASYRFVVCEHPATTVASLVQQPDSRIWNEAQAIATAKQLAVALSDLHRSGVETRGLHLGSIGIDGSGRVRLSPWPLAESPVSGDGSAAPMSELDLVAWVLESGAYPAGSRISPTTAGLAARLRERSREGAALTLDQLRAALGRLEPSLCDKPTGEVPVITGAVAATGAEAATGVVAAATAAVAATTAAVAATGAEATGAEATTTGAVAFGQDVQSHIYRRRRRARWPLAAGAGLAGLVAFLVISLGSSNSPLPAAATTNGAGACVSKTKGCSTGAATQSPNTTTATTAPVTPVTAPDAGSGVDVAASGATTTTTTEPSTTTTTTTTTTEPSTTTTTTDPASTTTTTVPSTTTTTQATAPSPGGQSAPAQP
jgi:hypothetical protein